MCFQFCQTPSLSDVWLYNQVTTTSPVDQNRPGCILLVSYPFASGSDSRRKSVRTKRGVKKAQYMKEHLT